MARKPSKNSKTRAVTTDRRLQALRLRQDGLNFNEIGEVLEISKSGAWQLVDKALQDYSVAVHEETQSHRQIEMLRLDEMFRVWFGLSLAGDKDAGALALKISAERSRLLGLYAPTRTELTGKGGAPLQTQSVNANIDLSKATDEQLAAMEAFLLATQTAPADTPA